jgi:type II secretory pathway pseudopilin PulG
MNAKRRQSGLTLTEMAVVVGVTALLAGLALPAVRMVIESFESGGSASSMISSALAAARGLAAREGHYVGVRFQKAYNRDAIDPLNPLKASQYMIFIIHDSSILASGYRVLEGTKPVKLPDSIGVMDMTIVWDRNIQNPINPKETRLDDPSIAAAAADALIDQPHELVDTTTFSVVFSPSGKLVTRGVRVRRENAADDVFNEDTEVAAGTGMFYQDDYFGAGAELGLGPEPSRNRFVIYDRIELRKAFEAGLAWSGYLVNLVGKTTYINPNTGTIISRK